MENRERHEKKMGIHERGEKKMGNYEMEGEEKWGNTRRDEGKIETEEGRMRREK